MLKTSCDSPMALAMLITGFMTGFWQVMRGIAAAEHARATVIAIIAISSTTNQQ
jgi:hypothetical protein